jgi:hypothetical protein
MSNTVASNLLLTGLFPRIFSLTCSCEQVETHQMLICTHPDDCDITRGRIRAKSFPPTDSAHLTYRADKTDPPDQTG